MKLIVMIQCHFFDIWVYHFVATPELHKNGNGNCHSAFIVPNILNVRGSNIHIKRETILNDV